MQSTVYCPLGLLCSFFFGAGRRFESRRILVHLQLACFEISGLLSEVHLPPKVLQVFSANLLYVEVKDVAWTYSRREVLVHRCRPMLVFTVLYFPPECFGMATNSTSQPPEKGGGGKALGQHHRIDPKPREPQEKPLDDSDIELLLEDDDKEDEKEGKQEEPTLDASTIAEIRFLFDKGGQLISQLYGIHDGAKREKKTPEQAAALIAAEILKATKGDPILVARVLALYRTALAVRVAINATDSRVPQLVERALRNGSAPSGTKAAAPGPSPAATVAAEGQK